MKIVEKDEEEEVSTLAANSVCNCRSRELEY